MTEDVQATIARLRQRVELAKQAKSRAEYDRQTAEKALADADTALKTEFGISTAEQAIALAGDLDSKIAAEAQAIETALTGAGI